ncbi:transcriptional regulator with PAS, ATPase and Fis domain [Alkalibacillus flavidus]|uniref:Transcriptional regulator with PAS, ATPase and Fis domain n=1 Tax=Alkalibacillus flavidus TaxID=546021 RepID=A0ABV2KTR4_9BACI
MSTHIKFIAPYQSMVPIVDECRDEIDDIEISIEVGNMEEGAKIAKEAERDGYDMIVSRGGTAQLLRHVTRIPVVDVTMSGYDILRVLMMGDEFNQKKALVGYPNMMRGAQAIIDLLELSVDLFTIDSIDEIEQTVYEIRESGYDVVIGDVGTVESAKRHGLEAFLIQTGRETILEALEEAKASDAFFKWNFSRTDMLSKIIKYQDRDVMVIDEYGQSLFEAWHSFDERPFTDDELRQLPLNVDFKYKVNWQYYTRGKQQIDVKIEQFVHDEIFYFLLHVHQHDDLLAQLDWVEQFSVKQKPTVIADSEPMQAVMRVIHSGVENHQLFFLVGDAGTGRGLLAHYIHHLSWSGKTLLEVDLSRSQFEYLDELLSPEVGTIYLRHLTQLPPERYYMLGRFLRKAMDTGKHVVISVNESVVHWFDTQLIDQSIEVFMPPLSDRPDDFKGLVTLFAAYFHQHFGTSVVKIQTDVIEELKKYEWRGHARELKSFLKSVVLSERGYVLKHEHVKKYLQEKYSTRASSVFQLEGTLDDIEHQVIQSVLEEEDYNQSKAARRLGINRSTLWRKLKQ